MWKNRKTMHNVRCSRVLLHLLGTAVLVLLGLAGVIQAQTAGPLPLPPGGSVRSLALDPFHADHLWLGSTTGAVFESRDDGAHWSFLSEVLPQGHAVVARLVPDPAHAGRLYAAMWSVTSNDGGVYGSNDGGQHWHALLDLHSVRALAVAPSQPAMLVAGALDGVFRSVDAGAHWQRISPAQSREIINVDSVAIDPRDPANIYVGTWHLPWKTFDGGKDWLQINKGVIDDSDVFSIAIDRQHPDTVYLSACSGIYRSDTAGMLFRKIQGIPYTARRTQDIVQDPLQPKILYAGTTQGLWKSQDGGDTWMRTTSDALSVDAVLLDPRHPGQVLLGTEHAGILLSRDGGMHFASANTGFSSRRVASLVEDPARHRIYVSVTGDNAWGGVFASADHGHSWRQINQGLRGDVYRLLLTPTALLAATEHGIDRYDDASSTWSRIPTSPAGHVYDLTAADKGATLYASAADGVYRSQDGGLQWRRLPLAPMPAYAVAASGHIVLAATNGSVLSSRDDGAHFSGPALYIAGRVNQLAYRGNLWLAATSRGLYFSRGRTLHWTLAGHGLPEEEIVAIHWQSDGIYVTTTEAGRMYRSRDEAEHWQAVPVTPQWDQVAHSLTDAFASAWETALEGGGAEQEAGRAGFHLGRGIPTMVHSPVAAPVRDEPASSVNH